MYHLDGTHSTLCGKACRDDQKEENEHRAERDLELVRVEAARAVRVVLVEGHAERRVRQPAERRELKGQWTEIA